MDNQLFEQLMENIPPENEKFMEYSIDILERIDALMVSKKVNRTKLSELLGKSKSEISKILNPGHNITLKTISKLAIALDNDILEVKIAKVLPLENVIINSNINGHKAISSQKKFKYLRCG